MRKWDKLLHFNPVGDFMALASAVCWACYSMAVTRLNSRNRPLLAAAIGALGAVCTLIGVVLSSRTGATR